MAEDSGYTPNYKPHDPDVDYDSDISTPGDQGDQESDSVDFKESDSSGGSNITSSEQKEIDTGNSEPTTNDSKVVASEPVNTTQAEATESDTVKKNGKTLDEDQVISTKDKKGEKESIDRFQNRLKEIEKNNRGNKTGRQAGNILNTVKQGRNKYDQLDIITQDNTIKVQGQNKTDKNPDQSVGERIVGKDQRKSRKDKKNQRVSIFGETILSEQDFERASQPASNPSQLQELRDKIEGNPDLGLQTLELLEARNSPTNKEQRQKDPVPFNPAARLTPGRSNRIQNIREDSNKPDGADFSDLKNLPSIVLGDKEFGETNQADNFNFTDVKQTADTAEKLGLSEGEFRTLVGQETSKKFSEDVTNVINPEENPITKELSEGMIFVTSGAPKEGFQAATSNQSFSIDDALTITDKKRDTYANIMGDVVGSAAAFPFQAQVRGGQAQQLKTGELKPGTAGAAAVLSSKKTVNWIKKNPSKAAAAGSTGFLLGGPTSLSKTSTIAGDTKKRAVNTLTGKEPSKSDFIDSGSKVLGTDFEYSSSNPPKTSDIPGEEKLPDFGEQAIGREIRGVQQEPQSQILGQNLEEQQLRQPETGRTGGVPKDQSGFYDEEIEVLRQRRERKPGVDNVESDIRGFNDPDSGKPSADEVAFEQQGNEFLIEETFDASNYMGVGLPGPKVKVTRPEVDPDKNPIDDQIRSGRVEGETDGPKIIEDRTKSRSRDIIDNNKDRRSLDRPGSDTGIDNALGVSTGLGLDQETESILNTGQQQGQEQGQEPIQEQFEDIIQKQDPDQPTDLNSPGDGDLDNFFRRNNQEEKILRDDSDRKRRRDRDLDIDFDRENQDQKNDVLGELVGDKPGRDVTSSVGAELLNIEGQKPSELSAQNPLNLRPEFN